MKKIDLIRKAGVIGAGGAGFPTYAKLGAKADFVIVNGAECEPLIRVDQQLMELRADDLVSGVMIALEATGASKALVGVKGKHSAAIAALNEAISEAGASDRVEVRIIKDVYPAGDEQILVYELTGRIVPETGIPIMVGCVVINSETAINISEAAKGNPVTEKYLTIAGDVPQPITLKLPVGAPIRAALAAAGLVDVTGHVVIDGGPMMGPLLSDADGYVTKKSKGYVVLKEDHWLARKKSVTIVQAKRINRSACEQCRMCTDLCPRYLIGHDMRPHMHMRALMFETGSYEGREGASLCCQCELCSLFSCPAGLLPKQANMYYKAKLMEQKIKYEPKKDKRYEARAFRDYRLVSTKRLVKKLGLYAYDVPAPLSSQEFSPEFAGISLRPHVGAPAAPTVRPGDRVSVGQKIGVVAGDALGAPVHASIDGVVKEVTDSLVLIGRN
jgi:Na+-translocating ferredoxin:NAD+ oxidoreductase RnfC subunit